MYPPGMFLVKMCTKPFELETPSGGTYEVEVGTPVAIPLYAIHNDPQHYPDPKSYEPERFTEENKKTRHRHSYFPFSDGPRMCLGTSIIIISKFQSCCTYWHTRTRKETNIQDHTHKSTNKNKNINTKHSNTTYK
jgi:cytochrome P450 family 6